MEVQKPKSSYTSSRCMEKHELEINGNRRSGGICWVFAVLGGFFVCRRPEHNT